MIEEEYFLGFPFPWLLRSSEGLFIAQGNGTLFPLSSNMEMDKEVSYLLTIEYGWTKSPSGYAAYVTSLSAEERILLVIFGLKVAGISSIRGPEKTLSIRLEKQDIEKYVKRTIEALRQSKEKLNLIMRTNIHEIRSINSDIYNAIYRLRGNIEQTDYSKDRDFQIIRNIEELSKVLRTRTDVLDVLSNPALLQASKNSIPIYRAFDRIVRSLNQTAISEGVNLFMSGSSMGRIMGIPLFDVIPYLVIQNAIKYAPMESDIEINFAEFDHNVVIKISSEGPLVEDSELERIFILGYRGKHARNATTDGLGFGMYLLRQLVEFHDGGTIKFSQGNHVRMIRDTPYKETFVVLTVDLIND